MSLYQIELQVKSHNKIAGLRRFMVLPYQILKVKVLWKQKKKLTQLIFWSSYQL